MFVTHIFLLTWVQFWTKPSFLDTAQPWHLALFSPPANTMSWRHGPFNSFHQNTRSRYTLRLPPHQRYAKKKKQASLKPRTFWQKKTRDFYWKQLLSFLRLLFFFSRSVLFILLQFLVNTLHLFLFCEKFCEFLQKKTLALLCFIGKTWFSSE